MSERTAAETRRWLEENGLTDAVARAAAELPPTLPPAVVELLRRGRAERRHRAAELAHDARTA